MQTPLIPAGNMIIIAGLTFISGIVMAQQRFDRFFRQSLDFPPTYPDAGYEIPIQAVEWTSLCSCFFLSVIAAAIAIIAHFVNVVGA